MCLLLFLANCGAMFYCAHMGFTKGDLGKLFSPLDGDEHFCGHEPGYEDYPHLYITYFDTLNVFTNLKTGVCVKECPDKGDAKIDCKATSYVRNCNDDEIIKNIYNTNSLADYCFPESVSDLP